MSLLKKKKKQLIDINSKVVICTFYNNQDLL